MFVSPSLKQGLQPIPTIKLNQQCHDLNIIHRIDIHLIAFIPTFYSITFIPSQTASSQLKQWKKLSVSHLSHRHPLAFLLGSLDIQWEILGCRLSDCPPQCNTTSLACCQQSCKTSLRINQIRLFFMGNHQRSCKEFHAKLSNDKLILCLSNC